MEGKKFMNLWNKARLFKIFVQLVRNPSRTELIFQGVEIVSSNPDLEPIRAVEQNALSHDDFKSMFEKHYVPQAPSIEELRKSPEGSFGRKLYQHMHANGLNFDLWPRYESERAIKYLSTRIYQDHDLWHTLLGYGITVEDELAVQAFGVAQLQSPVALMIVAGGLIHLMISSPRRAIEAFKKINEAYFVGKRARFLLSIQLHDLFAKPLGEVRELCGVSAVGT
jgi:ubiquinone biosynthesis protein COQ4